MWCAAVAVCKLHILCLRTYVCSLCPLPLVAARLDLGLLATETGIAVCLMDAHARRLLGPALLHCCEEWLGDGTGVYKGGECQLVVCRMVCPV